jgi:hypothetical protein
MREGCGMTTLGLTTVTVSEDAYGRVCLSYPECPSFSCAAVVWDRDALTLVMPQLQDYSVLTGVFVLPRPKIADDPVLVTLEVSQAALLGQDDVIDTFSQSLLSIPATRAALWREAVSMALLGGWYDALADAGNGSFGATELVRYLRKEVHRVHRQLQPLWERKVGGQRLHLLDKPVANGLSLRDFVSDGSGPDKTVLRTVLDDQRLASVLGRLAPVEQAVVRAWAYGNAATWQEAAERTGAAKPAELGERVRRELRRQGSEYMRRRSASTDTGLWLPPSTVPTTKAPK